MDTKNHTKMLSLLLIYIWPLMQQTVNADLNSRAITTPLSRGKPLFPYQMRKLVPQITQHLILHHAVPCEVIASIHLIDKWLCLLLYLYLVRNHLSHHFPLKRLIYKGLPWFMFEKDWINLQKKKNRIKLKQKFRNSYLILFKHICIKDYFITGRANPIFCAIGLR